MAPILDGVGQNLHGRAGQPHGARTRPAKVSPATYWRRRVVVLGAGFGLLTALGWLVNGALAARSTAGQAAPSGGTGAAGSAPPYVHAGGTPPAPPQSPSPSPAPARHRASKRPPVSGRTLACTRGSVRLTISSPQYWYQSGKAPRFT